ncbi:bifunctional hydroxymethylpyrimidine kinase/phosphomethylpyrimidine kinase [Agathobaculum sp.]|uniref:bifunctional hydroxymethylpyrimidine kinase/phosphomethylpyrimidine kinase n=1 Tax=Agathobaculum sp. TaxID=2048138 RepID=UPI002A83F081|nr:bifunctional hydroxymethylpyrimidine kinase/phosphomethylpyrimidine kinase [Agathobaculum sp.]MDY3617950.1 bifunctional hydroxymethylpyrimidine kinase/phosphomethylpyrimidine kinase [Agathobaculum sp.]
MKTVLSIAGSDCSGGAGIQADLKTIAAHKLYGMSVITALTAQNTTGVFGVEPTPAAFVARQIDCVFEDIVPDAVKLGMLVSCETIKAVTERLRFYHAKNIVLDPVMLSTSGHPLLASDAMQALTEQLFPLASVITPNLAEASALSRESISSKSDMERAAHQLAQTFRSGILLKGGHLFDCADDLLLYHGKAYWYHAERIDNPNTHGTGCTLSSAIACRLAQGYELPQAVSLAKSYLTAALRAGLNLGHGNGPLCHQIPIEEQAFHEM